MKQTDEAEAIAEFGRFRLLLRHRQLLADGLPIELGSRAFDILMVLIEGRGALVTKDEILRRVWPGTIVEENNLQVQISALRKVLGEDRNLIRTISGRGYRFTGAIRFIAEEQSPPEPDIGASAGGTRPAVRTNLPEHVSELIGRDAELDEVYDLVAQHRLVTVTGAGGIGKTRLGFQLAWRLLPKFPDGVWLAELASLSDARLVPFTVASALGIEIVETQPLRDRLAVALGAKRLLLVLDNCEHVIDQAARVGEELLHGAPGVRVLATSREPLGADGECIYQLAPLEVPPEEVREPDEILRYGAVRLFVARALAADPHLVLDGRSAVAAGAICRRLDGIPLALELAAARTAAFGITGLLTQLDDRLRLLTGGRRTALPRHQTLIGTLDWSYDLLVEAERVVLRCLAVFAPGFTLAAADAVAADGEIDVSEVVNRIASLVAKSLVAAALGGAATRYRLLETTRVYVLAKLRDSGDLDRVARRHAQYYRALFERAAATWQSTATAEWLAAYAPALDNLRAALDWAFAPAGDPAIGVALTAVSVPLWMQLSLLGECRVWVERALASLDAGTGRDARDEMRLRAALGLSLMHTEGPVGAVHQVWQRVLDQAEALGDVEHKSQALYGMWLYDMHTGGYRAALRNAHAFRDIAENSSDPANYLVGDRMAGVALEYLGDYAGARDHIERVYQRYVRPRHRSHAVDFGLDQRVGALIHMARIHWLQGLPDQAMRAAQASVEEARVVDHAPSMCFALADAACPVAAWVGDLAATERFGSMLIEQAGEHSFGVWHAYGSAWLGWAAANRRDVATAAPLLDAALQGVREARFYMYYTMYLSWLAETSGTPERIAQSVAEIDRAITSSEELWCFPELFRIKGELALLGGRSDASAAAADNYMQALDWARRQGALSWELRATSSLARLRRDQGRSGEARALLAIVYDRFSEGFDTADLRAAKTLIDELR
jgi:predicted ATPase/DNA-binding winged helix-turn-helix (wHTH) protein